MNTPTHQEVALRAYQIWEDYGSPEGRETEIWLEAEQQLNAELRGTKSHSRDRDDDDSVSESRGASGLAERLKAETAAESLVEYNISPAVSQDAAIKAALQKKEARAPQQATKTAPHAAPPESGKPLWSKAHSA